MSSDKILANKIQCVIFDLDGTLLDTAPDFATALNMTLKKSGKNELEFSIIRSIVSHGGHALAQLGFPELIANNSLVEFNRKKELFLKYYQKHIADKTSFFPALETAIQSLEKVSLPWAIATNKPEKFTKSLLQKLQFKYKPNAIICGDTLKNKKPHPEPLLTAAKMCNTNPTKCLYVGDHSRDIEAGLNANMLTALASYGYLTPKEITKINNVDIKFTSSIKLAEFIGRICKKYM